MRKGTPLTHFLRCETLRRLAAGQTKIESGGVLAAYLQTPAAQSLRQRLENGGALSLPGVAAPARPFLAAAIQRLFSKRPILVVTDNLKSQECFQQDLETWLNEVRSAECGIRDDSSPGVPEARRQTLFFPAWEILPHEDKLPHADVISERLETLVALTSSKFKVQSSKLIVANVSALLQRTFPPGLLAERTRFLRRGDREAPLDLIEWLEEQGYEPEAQVTHKGEIALRGGIVDVFPLTSPWPVRLEFFGDELESLRHFDPLTQISREEITEIFLPPAGELGILKRAIQGPASGIEHAHPLATLLDYLPREAIVLLCDPVALDEHADSYAAQVPEGDPFSISWEDFQTQLTMKGVTAVSVDELESVERLETIDGAGFLAEVGAPLFRPSETLSPSDAEGRALPVPIPNTPPGDSTQPHFQSLDAFRPLGERTPEPQVAEVQRREFFVQLHRWLRQGCSVHVFCNNAGERQRFEEIWRDVGNGEWRPGSGGKSSEDSSTVPKTHIPDARPCIHLGSLSRGFLCEEAKLVVVTDAEIFGRYKVQRPRRIKSPHAQATRSALDIDFADLETGDYVVHLQHGIGRYLGLQTLPTHSPNPGHQAPDPNSGTECLVIEFAPTSAELPPPKLYVPVSEAHLVGKYVGAGKARPPLNTLGGGRWAKTKAHAEKAIRDLAAELLAIQAKRETQPGHTFPADAPWQREFEGSFIYEETPDQHRAIIEAKSDMEKPKPMDRLICGDVGYGKTEVAIRAAFKAVMGGKQVAVLVPTTVLAQQHYNTFRERMADYPVRIELLSRFRSRRDQRRVLEALAAGSVDIVIGTHRLVQSDVTFKDLGFVVIDEEQRFGVLHKERFKRLRAMVDVLTLSATPIPRTLYLALTGARDMSTIQTPPQDRLPVETIVTQYDERVIRDAIQRELNRGGQVFFLHNRVLTIDTMKQRLMQLVPKARIVTGHGQMDVDDLERVMTAFVNGEADVLLSTSIIESGLDIPNANTIIIDRADRFGLSELYQLRGRVGRYKHQAFAYLLLPRHAQLLNDVRKRMSAIRQYASLGSGFKIAMRDLEIRGAGNLLGSEQSGHITAVGFELYCQLLKQSVSALKGEKVKPRVEVQVRLDFLELNLADAGRAGSPLPAADDDKHIQVHQDGAHGVTRSTTASLPHKYIPEPQHRIDIYRKLAQATDKAALDALQKELRDRFGRIPAPVELLLLIAEIKQLAAGRGITVIEAKESKLMLTRNNDYLTLGGKFPRLTKKDAKGCLREIKKLLLAL
jgi:transcription-repair coupling factor (superfamily II helicase)